MSSLISNEELLRLAVFSGKPPTSALHETGIDLEVLDKVFQAVKPELNFFGKFQFHPLSKSFENWWKDGTPWDLWLKAEPNVERFKQVIMLAYVEIIDSEGLRIHVDAQAETQNVSEYWIGYVRIYVTKSDEWIVWTNHPVSRFEIVKTPQEAIEIANGVLGEDEYFRASRFGGDMWPTPRPVPRIVGTDYDRVILASLAMEVAAQLVVEYEKFVEERARRVEDSRSNQKWLRELIDNIEI